MNRMSCSLVFLFVTAVGVAGAHISSAYAGCGQNTVIHSSQIAISPSLDCLDIEVVGDSCVASVGYEVINACDKDIVLTQTSPACRDRQTDQVIDCPQQPFAAGETSYLRDISAPERLRTEVQTRTLLLTGESEDGTFAVNVTYEVEVESFMPSASCSTAPLETPSSGSFALVVMALTVIGAGARTRRRAR